MSVISYSWIYSWTVATVKRKITWNYATPGSEFSNDKKRKCFVRLHLPQFEPQHIFKNKSPIIFAILFLRTFLHVYL